jgi:hypothetical protein
LGKKLPNGNHSRPKKKVDIIWLEPQIMDMFITRYITAIDKIYLPELMDIWQLGSCNKRQFNVTVSLVKVT